MSQNRQNYQNLNQKWGGYATASPQESRRLAGFPLS